MLHAVVLDIEGTTSSIRFVYDVLFPYVRRGLPDFLREHWNDPKVLAARARVAADAGVPEFETRESLLAHLFALMDTDSKAGGLKDLQGLVSRAGYLSGELRSHVYPDFPPALRRWKAAGLTVAIYSSGSVAAQKSLFGFTEAGDLLPHIDAFFDTAVGTKRSSSSYTAIAAALRLDPAGVLFFSDIVEELDAARAAGMQTRLVVRPGNKPVLPHTHGSVTGFESVA